MPQTKILILTASPDDQAKLRADKEIKAIEEELERSKNRDKFKIIPKLAVKPEDLIHVLQEEEPEIVHFCGHGKKTGLVFENESGEAQTVKAEALAKLFERFKDKVKCVLLNACYTDTQAEAINKHIQYVIGMTEQIEDTAAIKFAATFYAARIAGRSYKDAYDFGCIALDLLGIQDDLLPVFKEKSPPKHKLEEEPPNKPTPFHYNRVINAFKSGQVIPFLGPGINLYDGLIDIQLADYLERELGMAGLYQCLMGAPCSVCLLSADDLPPDCPVKKAFSEGKIAACPLIKEQKLAIAKLNLQCLAQYVKLTSSIQEVYQKLHEFFEFFEREYSPNKLHQFFANLPKKIMQDRGNSLPYKLLVTTNYDNMLERAFRKAEQPYDLIFYVTEGPENIRGFFKYKPHEESAISIEYTQKEVLKKDRPVILKLYGAINNFVIAEDHHFNYLVYRELKKSLPEDLLATLWGENHHILFMGYSPNDVNLRRLVNRLWGEKKIGQQSWMIHQSKPGELDREFWRKRNVDLRYRNLKEYLTELNQKIEELTVKKSHPFYKWETIR